LLPCFAQSPIVTLDHSTVAFRQHSEGMLVQYTTQIRHKYNHFLHLYTTSYFSVYIA